MNDCAPMAFCPREGDGDAQDVLPNTEKPAPTEKNGLDAHRDAREIIRMLQCPVCSYPLKTPMTLPCGNTVCRNCLPPRYQRQSITYPDLPGRREGFMCTFADCLKEHSTADCSVDVTLMKVLGIMEDQLTSRIRIRDRLLSKAPKKAGRLVTTYAEAKAGRLLYDAEFALPNITDDNSDQAIMDIVRSKAGPELDCHVCYGLLFDPITTRCGHTYCRKCLQRVLDHSQSCPACRQSLELPSVLPAQLSNKRLTEILVGLCPDELAQRAAAVELEESTGMAGTELDTAIFVCTNSFPGMPTPLFIFEPRYRLMIRRAWEGSKQFGMVLPNRHQRPQGHLGVSPFMEYGTMLKIEHMNVAPDGTSHIWTTGVSKFRVKAWGYRDEYIVAKTERLDDIPIAEEEALEALQTTRITGNSAQLSPWTSLSTSMLFLHCNQFVEHMQRISTPLMTENQLRAFGPPPSDPALFPYWLASLLPLSDEEKYRLVASCSVRERLLIAVLWVKSAENYRWFGIPGVDDRNDH